MRKELGRSATPEFFEFLSQLARNAQLSILQDVDRRLQRFRKPIRRFEKDRCYFTRGGGAIRARAGRF